MCLHTSKLFREALQYSCNERTDQLGVMLYRYFSSLYFIRYGNLQKRDVLPQVYDKGLI